MIIQTVQKEVHQIKIFIFSLDLLDNLMFSFFPVKLDYIKILFISLNTNLVNI